VTRRHQDSGRERPRTLGEILARKRELVERAAGQREELALQAAGLLPAFAAGDKMAGVGRSLLSRPWLLAVGGVILLALWPRAVFGLATRAFALWKGARAIRRLVAARG
jgi:hypothetical protein